MMKHKIQKVIAFRSLKVTLSVVFLLLSLLILLVAVGLGTYLNLRIQRDLINNQQRLIAKEAADTVKNFIKEKLNLLKATVNFGNLMTLSKKNQNSVMAKTIGNDPSFRQLILLNASGKELTRVSRTSKTVSMQIADQLLIKNIMGQVKKDAEYLGSIYIYETTSEPMMVMAVPVENIFGDFQGALVAEVNLKFMWDVVAGIKIGSKGAAYVVDRSGNLIAFGDASRVLKGENLSRLNAVAEYINREKSDFKSSAGISKGIQGTTVVSTFVALGSPDWAVVVELPFLEAYESVIQALKLTAVVMLASIFLAIAAGSYLSKRITKPIINLRDAAIKIGDGRLDTKIKIETRDEIGDLAKAFNRMAEDLEKTTVSKNYVDNIIGSMIDTLIVVSPDGRILRCNAAVCALLGFEEKELIGQPAKMIFNEELLFKDSSFDSVFIKSLTSKKETAYRAKDGRKIPMLFSASILHDNNNNIQGVVCVAQDISEQKKLEDQLRQAQKMEAVGTLAGGIAHDFNNILTAVIGYGHILKMKIKEDGHLKPLIDQILASSERAANLTQSLLAFSRRQISNPTPVSLNEIIKKVEKFLLRIIGEHIELNTMLSDAGLIVMADSGQLEHVLMNLATNSRDAMPTGGLLTISTELVELDEKFIKTHGYGMKGMYAVISVSDTGVGIDEKTKDKIFDPFFTTKEVGKGTGLGLAMAYGIIKQHKGYISVYSEVSKGTTFKIYLPVITEVERPGDLQPGKTAEIKGGTETVLIAEDETEIRKLSKTSLEELGYNVIEACDGEDAVNKFLENKEKIALLLFDVIMPKLSGREAYEKIKKIKPDIKVLFISGYPTDFINYNEIIEHGFNFISKPASPTLLLKKVREVLDK